MVTTASKRRPERLGFPKLPTHPPAGVNNRFAQMLEIVNPPTPLLHDLVLLLAQPANDIAQYSHEILHSVGEQSKLRFGGLGRVE